MALGLRIVVVAFVFTTLFPVRGFAQITQKDLRDFSEYAIRHKIVEITPPKLDWSGESLRYSLGGIDPRREGFTSLEDFSESGETDEDSASASFIPLQNQFTITAIRQSRNTPTQRKFWTPVLGRAEAQVSKMLRLIREGRLEGSDLEQKLWDQEGQITEMYHEELDRLAKEYGKDGALQETMMKAVPAIQLRTDPAGGDIFVMPAGRWSLYLFLRDVKKRPNLQNPQWDPVTPNEDVSMPGKAWIKATWPGGAEYKKSVRVKQARIITITPRGLRYDTT